MALELKTGIGFVCSGLALGQTNRAISATVFVYIAARDSFGMTGATNRCEKALTTEKWEVDHFSSCIELRPTFMDDDDDDDVDDGYKVPLEL